MVVAGTYGLSLQSRISTPRKIHHYAIHFICFVWRIQANRTIISSSLLLYAYWAAGYSFATSLTFLTPLVFLRIYTKALLRLVQSCFNTGDGLSRPSQQGTRSFPLDFASGREKGFFLPRLRRSGMAWSFRVGTLTESATPNVIMDVCRTIQRPIL